MKSVVAEAISKRYRIGLSSRGRFRYRSLREEVQRMLLAPFRALRDGAAIGRTEAFWALRDICFDIEPGEKVGIIGRNGAGKSTLLKILSRITTPTEGRIRLRGRVGSLLEVGTGFHPELTGRENVYLNGAILGMHRAEIRRQFDAIVAFAGIDRFLDTPVKRYSSGMYVRLAFAVAAHLDPEILLVDEVLAVGDAAFQRKCLAKMEDVAAGGRTILFVSHNMPSITRLCQRTLLLESGRLVADGPAHEVVKEYLQSGLGTSAERRWDEPSTRPGNTIVRLVGVRVHTEDGDSSEAVAINERIGVEITFDVLTEGHVLVPTFELQNAEGACVFTARDTNPAWHLAPRPAGRHLTTAWIPANLLSEGTHLIGVAVSTMSPLQVHFSERDAIAFEVIERPDAQTARGEFAGSIPGVVRPRLEWTNQLLTSDTEVATT